MIRLVLMRKTKSDASRLLSSIVHRCDAIGRLPSGDGPHDGQGAGHGRRHGGQRVAHRAWLLRCRAASANPRRRAKRRVPFAVSSRHVVGRNRRRESRHGDRAELACRPPPTHPGDKHLPVAGGQDRCARQRDRLRRARWVARRRPVGAHSVPVRCAEVRRNELRCAPADQGRDRRHVLACFLRHGCRGQGQPVDPGQRLAVRVGRQAARHRRHRIAGDAHRQPRSRRRIRCRRPAAPASTSRSRLRPPMSTPISPSRACGASAQPGRRSPCRSSSTTTRRLDHYFITWVPDEIAKLDDGSVLKGWTRTGRTMRTYKAAQAGILAGVPLLHSAGTGRLALLRPRHRGVRRDGPEEPELRARGPAVHADVPAGRRARARPARGRCIGYSATGRTPITATSRTRRRANEMAATGWLVEGDGPDQVVMCAPL